MLGRHPYRRPDIEGAVVGFVEDVCGRCVCYRDGERGKSIVT